MFLVYFKHCFMTNNADLRPKVKDHYRADKMALWSKLIPELMSNGNGKVFTIGNEDEDDGDVVTGGEGLLQFVFNNTLCLPCDWHCSITKCMVYVSYTGCRIFSCRTGFKQPKPTGGYGRPTGSLSTTLSWRVSALPYRTHDERS